jgi:hypothetical protein
VLMWPCEAAPEDGADAIGRGACGAIVHEKCAAAFVA